MDHQRPETSPASPAPQLDNSLRPGPRDMYCTTPNSQQHRISFPGVAQILRAVPIHMAHVPRVLRKQLSFVRASCSRHLDRPRGLGRRWAEEQEVARPRHWRAGRRSSSRDWPGGILVPARSSRLCGVWISLSYGTGFCLNCWAFMCDVL